MAVIKTVTLEDWLKEPEPPTTFDIPDGMALVFHLPGGKVAVQEDGDKLAIWCDVRPLEVQRLMNDKQLYVRLA